MVEYFFKQALHRFIAKIILVADLYVEVWYRSEENEIAGIDSNCVCVKIRKVVRVRARDLIADAIKELTTQHKFTVAHLSSAFQFGFF